MSVTYRDARAGALPIYRAALAPALQNGRLFEFLLSPLDRLGLPLWTVALIPEDGALADGFGYGANEPAAQTSAWGETIEWYAARESLKDTTRFPRRIATYAELVRQGEPAVDPISLCLSAGSDYMPEGTVLQWIETRHWPSGKPAWIPIEFVAPRAADIWVEEKETKEQEAAEPTLNAECLTLLAVPITNGSGAGPTRSHAIAHGILELLQRDGNSAGYRALDQGIAIELDAVQDPETRALLHFLDQAGIEVIVKLATTDFGMANLYVVGYDRDLERAPQPIALSACGEAVHPDREFALAKALREFTMARARKAFNHGPLAPIRQIAPPGYLEAFRPATMRSEDDRALREMQGWMTLSHCAFFEMIRHPVFDVRATVRFSELPTTQAEDADSLLTLLTERLNAAGLEIYYADLTLPDSPAHVVKVVVPGLEVETATYKRIGVRNLKRLLERGSPLVGLGNPPEGAEPIRLTKRDTASLGENAWFDPVALNRIVGPLYPLYREPGRHVIGVLNEARELEVGA